VFFKKNPVLYDMGEKLFETLSKFEDNADNNFCYFDFEITIFGQLKAQKARLP
jgi:hypothetical protein